MQGSVGTGNHFLRHFRSFKNWTNFLPFKLVYIVVSYRNVLLARHAVRHFRNKKGTGTEMRTAIVSSIVTGDVPVSYWPISNSPRSLFESQLGPVSSFLKCRISQERLHSSSLAIFCENTVKIENEVHTQDWKGLRLIVS